MTPIDFHLDAAQEANDAVDYYDGLRPGLGNDFRVELEAALARIQQNPQLFAVERGSIRRCPLDQFPYSVYYAELADRIWVAAVGHHSRRPGYWVPEAELTEPKIAQVYTADGAINDLHDVKLGITYTSEFAYLADGKNGLRVVQLTSPHTPGNGGFPVGDESGMLVGKRQP